jgi:uncharacterized protein
MTSSRPIALPADTGKQLPSPGLQARPLLFLSRATGLLLFVIVCSGIHPAYAAPISLTSIGAAYTQSFDTLFNAAGSTTNALILSGWAITEAGGGARDNELYAVDTGASTTGDTYSYGASGSVERALGMLRSGTLISTVGASFTNNTGVTINSLDVAYTGEEWRLGTAGRSDQISFEYSLNATDLLTGTWTGVGGLNFVTPDTATTGAKNGNAASSRTQLSSTISGLNIPDGATFWVRWTDADAVGADDGLAIDDFSLTPHSLLNPFPILSINDVSLNEGNSGTTTFTFTVYLSAPAGAGGVTFDIATTDNSATSPGDYTANSLTGQTIPAGSSTYTFTVLVNGDTTPETNETFFVNVINVTGAVVGDAQGLGSIINDDIDQYIHGVQGSGAATPIAGATVTVEGVVTASLQGANQLQGFFLQEEDADADADPATSEGIFVFCNACSTPVAEGQRVRVNGTISEFSGMTEITASSAGSVVVTEAGNHLAEVTPSPIALPISGDINAFYEAREGMLVTFMDTLTVADMFQFSRYGQIVLFQGGRPRQFTEETPPDVAGYASHLDTLARRRVLLDDDNNAQEAYLSLPDGGQKLFYPQTNGGLSVGSQGTDFFRGGDSVSGLTGVLHWSFAGGTGSEAWRIRPTAAHPVMFTVANPRPATPPEVGGAIRAAAVNLMNYFTTIDTTSSSSSGPCGPSGTQDCRGADSFAELNRQRERASIVACTLDAHIVAFTELENTTPSDTITDLLGAINARCGGEHPYASVNTGGTLGSDAIRVGLIYRTGIISTVGSPLSDLDPIHDRPPTAQTFDVVDAANPAFGERLTVIANHFRSKGGGGTGPDADAGDGQGYYADRRTKQAERLLTWITGTVVPAAGDTDLLLLGDFNAYARETEVTTLTNGGYTDLERYFSGAGGYTYVIDGELGHLDHAFASLSLVPKVTGSATWHINVDETDLFDYNDEVRDIGESTFDEKPDGSALVPPRVIFQPGTPFRASDHDPLLVGLFQVADLAVSKIDTPDPVIAGANLTYTITVTNNGPDVASSVALTDTLPVGTTFVSLSSPTGWNCVTPSVEAIGTVSCSAVSLPLKSDVFTLVVKVGQSASAGTVITNTATVSSSAIDPNQGNNSAIAATTVNAALSINFNGSGSGTVRSTPPDSAINCTKGSDSGCSAGYPQGTSVTLVASPDWKSLFGGWSVGVTSSANPLTFTMDANRAVTANFNPAPLLQVGPSGYPTLQAAYDAALNDTIIQMLDNTDVGALNANREITVTLKGGYDSGYTVNAGTTEVTAPIIVEKRRVTVERIIIR